MNVASNNYVEPSILMTTDRMSTRADFNGAGWFLRPAVLGDLPFVTTLLASCSLPVEGVADQFGDHYVIAEHAGSVIGVAGVEHHGAYGLLRSVAVNPEWRLGGVGAALVRDRLQWAEEAGVQSIFLLTTDAARFFHGHGFRAVSREKAPREIASAREFTETCPSSAQLMRFGIENSKGGVA